MATPAQTVELCKGSSHSLQGGAWWLLTSPFGSTCWQVGHKQQSKPVCWVLACKKLLCHELFLFFLALVQESLSWPQCPWLQTAAPAIGLCWAGAPWLIGYFLEILPEQIGAALIIQGDDSQSPLPGVTLELLAVGLSTGSP